jgi:uncharacterized protein with HEPN domain
MPQRDDQVSLRQMLSHAREALALAKGKSRQDLDRERVLVLALLQLLQIIGEAASRISPAYCTAHPEIPWPQIVALRNRLIHGYDVIDLDIVWSILTTDLPRLVVELERLTAAVE